MYYNCIILSSTVVEPLSCSEFQQMQNQKKTERKARINKKHTIIVIILWYEF